MRNGNEMTKERKGISAGRVKTKTCPEKEKTSTKRVRRKRRRP